jgi:hypothetical protein
MLFKFVDILVISKDYKIKLCGKEMENVKDWIMVSLVMIFQQMLGKMEVLCIINLKMIILLLEFILEVTQKKVEA